jgi:DNA repair exonuclease SbcCD nuclease subunit
VDRGVRPFQFAARKGIPVFLIPGNHERSRLPIGLLPFSNDNINLFAEPCSYLFQKNGASIKITGFPHIRHKAGNTFPEILKTAWNNCSCNSVKYDFSILVVHQLFAGSRVENYTFRSGVDVVPMLQVLRKFDYIACGHVHRFQFLKEEESCMLKSATRLHAIKQDHSVRNRHFGDEASGYPHSPSPVTAYAGSLERVSIQERSEPKGYIIGEMQPSTTGHRTMHSKYQFHQVSAVKMMHTIWDLSKASLNDCVSQTLEEMYDLHSTCKPNRNKHREGLTGIIKVRIHGPRAPGNTLLDHLKQEAQRLRFYLTIRW